MTSETVTLLIKLSSQRRFPPFPPMSRPIPETGQQFEVVRVHEVSADETVAFIRELRNTLSLHTLIINDHFSIAESIVVECLLTYCRNYMLTTHFSHYQRLNVNLAGWTPSKGRALFQEEVPDIFVQIARHLARPRLLIDGSVSLPRPTLPLPNGQIYNGLDAVANNAILRNQVVAGPPLPSYSQLVIQGTATPYRPRAFTALRRNFASLKMTRLYKQEGLVPARLCYWNDSLGHFVHFLDLEDPFDRAIFDIDCILTPIVIDIPVPPVLPNRPTQDLTADAAGQLFDDVLAYFNSKVPQPIQWMAMDHISGNQAEMSRTKFLEQEASGYHVHSRVTTNYAQQVFMSKLGAEMDKIDFPEIGIVDPKEVADLRMLANDYGTGHPTSRGRNRRRDKNRSKNKHSRVETQAKSKLSGRFNVTEEKAENAGVDETLSIEGDPSDADALEDSIQSRKKKDRSKNAQRRKSNKPS